MGFADFFQNLGRGLADPELSDGQGRLNLGKLGYNFSPEGSAMLKQRADLAKQHGIQDMATSRAATDMIPFQSEATKTDFQHQAEVHKGAIAAIHDIATHYGGEGQGGFRQFQAGLEGQDAKTQGELAGADLNREQSAGLAQNRQATGKDIQKAQSNGGYGTVPYVNQAEDHANNIIKQKLEALHGLGQQTMVPGASKGAAKGFSAIANNGNEEFNPPQKPPPQQGPDPALAKQHEAELKGLVKGQGTGEQTPAQQEAPRTAADMIKQFTGSPETMKQNYDPTLQDFLGTLYPELKAQQALALKKGQSKAIQQPYGLGPSADYYNKQKLKQRK